MLEKKIEQVYYESEVIQKAVCDICNKDMTNENFFKLDLGYYFVPDKKGSFIQKVYDENSCNIHICEFCAKDKLNNVCNSVKEYIEDNLI
jgi:hypothetical protein